MSKVGFFKTRLFYGARTFVQTEVDLCKCAYAVPYVNMKIVWCEKYNMSISKQVNHI